MIQFSSENIEYPSDQFTQTLILTNPGIVQILFKVLAIFMEGPNQ